jgi:hypothetical protein
MAKVFNLSRSMMFIAESGSFASHPVIPILDQSAFTLLCKIRVGTLFVLRSGSILQRKAPSKHFSSGNENALQSVLCI